MLGTIAASGVQAPFNPSNIAEVTARYSAEALTGYTDGQNIGSAINPFPDISGSGNNAPRDNGTACYYRVSGGPTGGPSIEFVGAGQVPFWYVPAAAYSGQTSGEIFCVFKATAYGRAPMGSGSSWPQFSQIPMNATTLRTAIFVNGSRYDFTVPFDLLNQWVVLNIYAGTNDYGVLLNNTHVPGSPLTSHSFGSNGHTLGYDVATSDGGSGFIGHVTSWIVCNAKLSASDRQSMYDYLTTHMSGGT